MTEKNRLRKTRLIKFTEQREERQTAFAELYSGYSQWHEANYDEQGNVRREREKESEQR